MAAGALGTAVLGAGVLLAGPPIWLLDRLALRYPGCLYRVPSQAPLVALTLDDGPDPVTTPRILAELRRHNARATFFLISERARGQEELLRRIVEEGHELANHFTRDRPSIRLNADEFCAGPGAGASGACSFRTLTLGTPRIRLVLPSHDPHHEAAGIPVRPGIGIPLRCYHSLGRLFAVVCAPQCPPRSDPPAARRWTAGTPYGTGAWGSAARAGKAGLPGGFLERACR